MEKPGEHAEDEAEDGRWVEAVERIRSLANGPKTAWRGKPSETGVEVLKPHPHDLPTLEPNSTVVEIYMDTAQVQPAR